MSPGVALWPPFEHRHVYLDTLTHAHLTNEHAFIHSRKNQGDMTDSNLQLIIG